MIVRVGGSAPYEQRYGYCRLVIAGEWALTAGTTAIGPDGVLHPGDAHGQARAAFGIALDALARAGIRADRVVRTRIYIVDPGHQSEVGRAHGEILGDVRRWQRWWWSPGSSIRRCWSRSSSRRTSARTRPLPDACRGSAGECRLGE